MLLLKARETVIQYFRPELKRRALTEQQWRVMRVLDALGMADAGTVAEQACILPPSLTGVLDRMERDGLILRTRIDGDQRKVWLMLTDKSASIVHDMHGMVEAQYRLIEQRLGQRDLQLLYDLLDRIEQLGVGPESAASPSVTVRVPADAAP